MKSADFVPTEKDLKGSFQKIFRLSRAGFYSIIYLMKSQYNKIKLRIRIPSISFENTTLNIVVQIDQTQFLNYFIFIWQQNYSLIYFRKAYFIKQRKIIFFIYVFTQEISFCVIGWREVWCWDQSDIKHLVNHNNNLITRAEMGEGEQTQSIFLNFLLSNFLQNDNFHWIFFKK